MADSFSPEALHHNFKQSDLENSISQSDLQSVTPPPVQQLDQHQEQSSDTSLPTSTTNVPLFTQTPFAISCYAPSQIPLSSAPQFSPVPHYHNPGTVVQPPGVGVTGAVAQSSTVSVPMPSMPFHVFPGQPPTMGWRHYVPTANGYVAVPGAPPGPIPPPGTFHYPFRAMVRPLLPPRPPGPLGMLPVVSRPPVPGIPGARPIISPIIRPACPSVTPAEKPQTTVYVGKIAATVDNDFMLSILQICGPVKSWKRAQDPTDGAPRGFGFCEFESAEGVLRVLRLLSKFNIDGQELVLNVNQATREYLERYVAKKTENCKNLKEVQPAGEEKDEGITIAAENNESSISTAEELNSSIDKVIKENDMTNFGVVTDGDKEGDCTALEKLFGMIDERLKAKPLPSPSLHTPANTCGGINTECPTKMKGAEPSVGIVRNVEDKNGDMGSENKTVWEDRPQSSSPDKIRRYDRISREKDRERDFKREKEREIERYERETERERARRDRELKRKIDDAEREYEKRVKDWEYREREKEKQRQYEKEREREKERKWRKEILHDEEEEDDSRKRSRRSVLEDKRRKWLVEKEEDMTDRLKEEQENTEAKRRAEEEKLWLLEEKNKITEDVRAANWDVEDDLSKHESNVLVGGEAVIQNGTGDESTPQVQQSGNGPSRKLGFGLVGSGKRAAVPSVFHEEDDDVGKEKKMRPLVPIDYSTEELQAVQPGVSGAQPANLVAAAEYAKRIHDTLPKEDVEKTKRSYDRPSYRDKFEPREKIIECDTVQDREHCGADHVKVADKQKLLDAKQLIDMIPKTKPELFTYEINWFVFDEHGLHERMRPWISKKITEFLGEEENTLVDYIVSSTQEHVTASEMLEMLQGILDDEAEMFVLKMWRMLIYEIKKKENCFSPK